MRGSEFQDLESSSEREREREREQEKEKRGISNFRFLLLLKFFAHANLDPFARLPFGEPRTILLSPLTHSRRTDFSPSQLFAVKDET